MAGTLGDVVAGDIRREQDGSESFPSQRIQAEFNTLLELLRRNVAVMDLRVPAD
jgi:hypothetical protein